MNSTMKWILAACGFFIQGADEALAGAPFQASAEDPRFAEARRMYYELKDEDALALINEYLLRKRDDPMALLLRTLCLRNLRRWNDVVEDLKERKDLPLSIELLFLEAQALVVEGGLDQSLERVNRIISDEPDEVEPKVTRVKLYLLQNKTDVARADLEELRRSHPRLAEPAYLLGQLMEHRSRYSEAMQLFYSLVHSSESNAFDRFDRHLERDAVLGMARVNLQAGKYQEAKVVYEQLHERDPKNAGHTFMMGVCEGMMEHTQDCIRYMKEAIEQSPDVMEYHLRLGDVYRSALMWPEAIEQFEFVLERSTDKALGALRLAEAYLETDKLDKARVNAELSASLQPQSADVQDVLGRVREKLGEPDEAKTAYRKSFEINPIKFETLYRLALLLSRSEVEDEQKEGRALLERYRRIEQYWPDLKRIKSEADLSPRNPSLWWRMGGVLNVAGEYDQAMVFARRAISIDQSFVAAVVLVGMVSANTGNDADALRAFEHASEMLRKMSEGRDLELQGWIDILKKGEKLPIPLGTLVRQGRIEKPLEKVEGGAPPDKDGGAK